MPYISKLSIIVLVLGMSLAPATSAAPPKVPSALLKQAQSITPDPRGKRILVVTKMNTFVLVEQNGRYRTLTRREVPSVKGEVDSGSVRWSPDANRFAFKTSDKWDEQETNPLRQAILVQVAVGRLDGGQPRILLKWVWEVGDPAWYALLGWSTDGKALLVHHYIEKGRYMSKPTLWAYSLGGKRSLIKQ